MIWLISSSFFHLCSFWSMEGSTHLNFRVGKGRKRITLLHRLLYDFNWWAMEAQSLCWTDFAFTGCFGWSLSSYFWHVTAWCLECPQKSCQWQFYFFVCGSAVFLDGSGWKPGWRNLKWSPSSHCLASFPLKDCRLGIDMSIVVEWCWSFFYFFWARLCSCAVESLHLHFWKKNIREKTGKRIP